MKNVKVSKDQEKQKIVKFDTGPPHTKNLEIFTLVAIPSQIKSKAIYFSKKIIKLFLQAFN